MHRKISPLPVRGTQTGGPSLPKRGNFPPFGIIFLSLDRQREVRRDFIKRCHYYYETVNKTKSIRKWSFWCSWVILSPCHSSEERNKPALSEVEGKNLMGWIDPVRDSSLSLSNSYWSLQVKYLTFPKTCCRIAPKLREREMDHG